MTRPTVITIGNFDGVHIGHTQLVRRARQLAGPAGRVLALAFDPPPATLLRPDRVPSRLSTFARRRDWLMEAGADDVHALAPTASLLGQSADAFVEHLAQTYAPVAVVEGPDFRYGHDRAGSVASLAAAGLRLGFSVDVVPAQDAVLNDLSVVTASSTLVRRLLATGRVADAAAVLGRPYELRGLVAPGDRLGRTIGVPTANLAAIATDHPMLPADGVYAALARTPDGKRHAAAVNIGVRPTVAGRVRRVEAHLLDHAGAWSPPSDLPEYGWDLELHFLAWVRDQVRFPGVEALRAQLQRDLARVTDIVRSAEASRDARRPRATSSAGVPS